MKKGYDIIRKERDGRFDEKNNYNNVIGVAL